MYIKPDFVNQNIYHIFNRGVAKQDIFRDKNDYQHFLNTFSFYLEKNPDQRLSKTNPELLSQLISIPPKNALVEILAYCLMPNHFHLMIRQLTDNGITTFARRFLDSYARYFNTKYDRVGTIFQGRFKAVLVENDIQLVHLSRYIHLNAYLNKISNDFNNYKWSSLPCYLKNQSNRICHPQFIIDIIGSPKAYLEFTSDFASYARDLQVIKNKLLDTE